MKVLFITDDFYPNFGANSLIVKTLGQQLAENGNSVYVMPFSCNKQLNSFEVWNGIHIIRTIQGDNKSELINLIKNGRFADAFRILLNRIRIKIFKINKVWLKEIVSAKYRIEKVIGENSIDLVISTHCSIECSFPLYRLRKQNKLPCKWLFYMLDPFATHSYYVENFCEKDLFKTQHKLLSACDKVFCSQLILNEIKGCESAENLKKVEVVEYPKIQNICTNANVVELDKQYKHFVCVGTFNQSVRPADYLFKIIDSVKEQNFKFHFLGDGWDEDNPFNIPERENCVFYSRLSWEEALSFECSCDYLINVGNLVKNQFPSKVLEYICTGKPIIDLAKYKDTPTVEYIEKYKNGLILFEEDDIAISINRLYEFLSQPYKQVEFDIINNLFENATPEYVELQLEKTLDK